MNVEPFVLAEAGWVVGLGYAVGVKPGYHPLGVVTGVVSRVRH